MCRPCSWSLELQLRTTFPLLLIAIVGGSFIMQLIPRQTTSSASTSSINLLDPPGPSLNSTSVTVTSNITSTSVPSTSTPPSTSLTSPPPSVTDSRPPTSLPPSTNTSDPLTSPPHSDPTSSDISSSNTSSFTDSITHSLSFPGATPLENITTIVTSINGQVTTFTSQLPTSLVDATPNTNSGSSSRTAVIAGTTAGLIVLLCLALAAVFGYRRHRLRLLNALALTNQRKRKEGKGLLDGEEFDDDDVDGDVGVLMRWHQGSTQQRYAAMAATGRAGAGSPTPSLIRSRVSETGSIFREEVWPPPGFVDPIKQGSSQVNLGHIVDDVMGPTHQTTTPPTSTRSRDRDPFASTSDDSHSHYSHQSHAQPHRRDTTDASASSSGRIPSPSPSSSQSPPAPSSSTRGPSSSSDPFNPGNDAPSVYYPALAPTLAHSISQLPPGASPPSIPGQAQVPSSSYPASSHPSAAAAGSGTVAPIPRIMETPPTPTPGPVSFQQQQNTLNNTVNSNITTAKAQPKKSSPLARPLSGDASIWLGRSPHTHPT